DAVLIAHAPVAGNENDEVAAIPECEPGAAIAQDISVCRRGGVECGAHSLADFLVPAALLLADIDPRCAPQRKLGEMRTGAVAAGNEARGFPLDARKRSG